MWESMFLYAAMAGGAVLVLQFFLLFLGGDHHGGGFDFDGGDFGDGGGHGDMGHSMLSGQHDGNDAGNTGDDPAGSWFLEMISLRTLAACALFFGLVGLTARSYDLSVKTSLLMAVGAGFLAMYSVYWMFQQLFRLESSGHQEIANAVGLPATVYLRVPARNEGRGKVHLTMQQRIVEYPAVTAEAEPIPTGEGVWVAEVVCGDTLRIAREEPAELEE